MRWLQIFACKIINPNPPIVLAPHNHHIVENDDYPNSQCYDSNVTIPCAGQDHKWIENYESCLP